jgi:hypothetical protein
MKKTVTYKKIDIVIEVRLNSVKPAPPAIHDTAPRHSVEARVEFYGFVHQRETSDLHLNSEVDKAEQAAKEFIDEKTKKPIQEIIENEKDHIINLTEKGFK